MYIRVLGSHGSDLLVEEPNGKRICRSVGFLVNDVLMVDAGTLASGLNIEEQKSIRHILLSHLHLDHIKEIPPLADNLFEIGDQQVVVAGLSSVMNGLKRHVFNDIVFPNFFELQGARPPILRAQALEANKYVTLTDGLKVTPIPVNHTVETSGFVIQDDNAAWIYSGDTYLTDKIWQTAANVSKLKGIFIEVSFPDAMLDIAIQSKHLTPTLLAQEFRKIGKPDLPLYVYHMKPTVREAIIQEIAHLDIANVTVLEEGQIIQL